ncbi:Phosphatidylglycerol/phosphatidylinositol transfer protein, partial [Irineochytrium annulatum]
MRTASLATLAVVALTALVPTPSSALRFRIPFADLIRDAEDQLLNLLPVPAGDLPRSNNDDDLTTFDGSVTSCGTEEDIFQPTRIELIPDPPKRGASLTVIVEGDLTEDVTEGAHAYVQVKLGVIKLVDKRMELCDEIGEIGRECPVEKGRQEIEHTVDVPREVPPVRMFRVQVTSISARLYVRPNSVPQLFAATPFTQGNPPSTSDTMAPPTPDPAPILTAAAKLNSSAVEGSYPPPPSPSSHGTVVAPPSPDRTPSIPLSNSPARNKRSSTYSISDTVTSAAVKAAVMLKQSPIPDTVASITQSTLTGYTRVDAAFGIQDRLVNLGQEIVKKGVVVGGIAANAFIRAGVAYQVAPGYRDLKEGVNGVGGSDNAGGAGGSGRERQEVALRILRLDRMPGGMPLPDLVEASTQTEPNPDADGTALPLTEVEGSVPTTAPSGAAQSQPKQIAKKVSKTTLFGSIYNTTTSLATTVLTASSDYAFGKETTRKLLGDGVDQEKEDEKATEGVVRNLVVGGVFYATTLETLRRVPNSRLARMFAYENRKEWRSMGVLARDGNLFVDRDGKHFRHVLNHLRGLPLTGTIVHSPDDLHALRLEAVYYDLVGLVVEIDERLAELDESRDAFDADDVGRDGDSGICVDSSANAGQPNSMEGATAPVVGLRRRALSTASSAAGRQPVVTVTSLDGKWGSMRDGLMGRRVPPGYAVDGYWAFGAGTAWGLQVAVIILVIAYFIVG